MADQSVKIVISADGSGAVAVSKEVGQAYRTLGTQSIAALNEQKAAATAAYETIKNSGIASAQEIRQAQGAMHKQIAQLNEQLVGNYGSTTSQIKEHWLSLSAGAVTAIMAINKVVGYMEIGAKAMQIDQAFRTVADASKFNADAFLENMHRLTAGTMTDSEIAQKSLKGITQGLSETDMAKIGEMARLSARTQGIDVQEAFDRLTDSIANKVPRALKQFGLITTEQMRLVTQGMAAGVDDINLMQIAYINLQEKEALTGKATDNATEAIQRHRAEIRQLTQDIGVGLVNALGDAIEGFSKFKDVYMPAVLGGFLPQPGAQLPVDLRGYAKQPKAEQGPPELAYEAGTNPDQAKAWADQQRADWLKKTQTEINAPKIKELRLEFEAWKVSIENLNPALDETARKMNEVNKEAAKYIAGKPGAAPGTTIGIPKGEVEQQQAKAAGYLQQQALLKNAQMNAKMQEEGVKQQEQYSKEYETLFNQVAGSRVNAEQVALAKIDTEERKRVAQASELALKSTWDYVNAKKIDTITAEESEKLLTQIHEDAERQRLALTTKNQAAMATAESEQRLAAIDYQQKMGLISPAQGISAKLGENQSLLSSLEGWKAGLEAAGQTGDQVYQSILQKIKAVEKATTDLTVANQVYVGSFGEGMKIEILKYSASVNSAFNAGASLANTASKAMENSFTSFFDATSKKFLDFNSLALSVFGDIERQAIKLAISQPLTNSIMGSLGGLFGGGTQVVPGIAGGLPANAPYVPGSAHGNLFSGGHLVPFGAGGIVDSPVIFPMASGAGIMGEGGRPEAVMPLTRTSSGDLGVRAAGTGAPSMMTNVTINTPPGTKVAKQTETKRFDGRQWVKNLSIDLAATDLEYQSAHGLR